MGFLIENDLILQESKVVCNPENDFYRRFLRPYYVRTRDGQYLFGSTQPGRRPDRAFYMVPKRYNLGKGQKSFDTETGRKIYALVKEYLSGCKAIVQDRIQGDCYKTGLRVVTSIENPHSAYMAWMGKLMTFPSENLNPSCFNYIVPERLPREYVKKILEFWPNFDPDEPLTLYDFTEMDRDVRRVLNLRVDYFGGAYKKPNLTMVWNRGESEGMISYHAGCTDDRVLKGLSGTGKTTLTLGPDLEQDDALLGKPYRRKHKVRGVNIVGLEAASFAKSEGLNKGSPEWPGLMASKKGDVVLCLNIDCANVKFVTKKIRNHTVKVPLAWKGRDPGSLQCGNYRKSKTTNGRFVFHFDVLNEDWGLKKKKLRTESLSFRRFDIVEPIFRVTDPRMAVALDSACESIITSAVAGRKPGKRVRSYAATDFMAREQSEQALLKMKVYGDMGLGPKGRLVFFINNSGYVGECSPKGDISEGRGEKIRVRDSKKMINLVEDRKIENWIRHPVFGYLIPEPSELEEKGVADFRKRFNPLNYYTPKQFLDFCMRDINERTLFLKGLFSGQKREKRLSSVTGVWEKCKIPTQKNIKSFYENHY